MYHFVCPSKYRRLTTQHLTENHNMYYTCYDLLWNKTLIKAKNEYNRNKVTTQQEKNHTKI
jgi:hypothetical protein